MSGIHDWLKEASKMDVHEGGPEEMKDNGIVRTFASGYQRDTAKNKPHISLILKAYYGLCAINERFEEGAKKYGNDNWRKGAPLSTFAESASRHLMQAMAGFTNEPHWKAAGWNILCLLDTKKRIELGELQRELDDLGICEP